MVNWKRKCEKCGRWCNIELISINGDISYRGKCSCGNEYRWTLKKGETE